MRRCAALALATTALLAATAGCSNASSEHGQNQAESAASAPLEPSRPIVVQGTFSPYTAGATAVTYNPKLVPAGAWAHIAIAGVVDTTTVTLTVNGLLPNRSYGAHLHTMACGAEASMAGPHYQYRHDPAASASPPSVDPMYANPQNEVWLDFTTDSQGSGVSKSTQPWLFSMPPQSLVIHAEKTRTTRGKAGMAGARLACLTLRP
jgi:Cu-Zn family superoxide dismutase